MARGRPGHPSRPRRSSACPRWARRRAPSIGLGPNAWTLSQRDSRRLCVRTATRAAHLRYGVSVLFGFPALTVRAVWAVGQDDPAIRSGQLRLTCSGPTRSRCRFRIDREALATASSRTGASRRLEVTDHPRLFGWSSLHPAHRQSLTPLCRRSGTDSPVPGPTASWLDARVATNAVALTRATETVTLPHLAELQERRSGRLPPCRDRPGFPPAVEPCLPPGLEASQDSRTVLASRPPPCASARRSESP